MLLRHSDKGMIPVKHGASEASTGHEPEPSGASRLRYSRRPPPPSPPPLYLSFDALSSRTASFSAGPSSALAKQRMLVVLPVPGGPCG